MEHIRKGSMKKGLFLTTFIFLHIYIEGSSVTKIRRTFSCCPAVDELKQAFIQADYEKVLQLMPFQFPRNLHAQYVYLGLSQKQAIRNMILHEIFVRWNTLILENPQEALGLLRIDLVSLARDYGTDLDQGFLEILSRLQVALLMCPIISESEELRLAVLKIAPKKNIFITAYTYANQNQQSDTLRDRKVFNILKSRPYIATPWPLHTNS